MSGHYRDLADKVVVVTGGSSGIGKHTAREFAAQGAKVAVLARRKELLDAVVEDIVAAGGTALAVPADVTDADALTGARERIEAELGPVDVLAAFAGGVGGQYALPDLTEQVWREVLDVNLTSTFLTVQAFLPGFRERGSGAIITMSSTAGRQPSQANLAYGVANAGIVMLTRQLATMVGPDGVRVNCIAPSSIRTEKVQQHMPPEVQEKVAAMHPLRRIGEMGDVAQTALFLASDAAAWLTGLTIDVTGGRVTN